MSAIEPYQNTLKAGVSPPNMLSNHYLSTSLTNTIKTSLSLSCSQSSIGCLPCLAITPSYRNALPLLINYYYTPCDLGSIFPNQFVEQVCKRYHTHADFLQQNNRVQGLCDPKGLPSTQQINTSVIQPYERLIVKMHTFGDIKAYKNIQRDYNSKGSTTDPHLLRPLLR